ncbi:MAG: DivIVA domain-containing protein [Lachnospiraceae bacterium]|nr:DivIVA domain-containing protein [Lachnospiraceae bacterium]
MLTPVDIQQKRFHVGLGYDKKDVNTFFEEVCKSYEELYRSNADLKDRVITLTDGLQNYKSKEAALEKSLMLAEKDAEDTKSSATKEAKTIKSEAKAKAQSILKEAEERLEQIKAEIAVLETQYAAYKTNFCNLMKRQFEFMKEEDFDADAYIDEKALGVLVAAGGGYAAPSAGSSNSFSYSGDPQMRDESTLGGMNNSNGYSSREELNSTSAVYTSNLGANENFVDPFNPTNKGNGRYNPYDSLNPKKDRTNEKAEDNGEKKSSFTVNTGNKNRARRSPVQQSNGSSASSSNYTNPNASVPFEKTTTESTKRESVKVEEPKSEPVKEEPKYSSSEEVKTDNRFSTTNDYASDDFTSSSKLDDDVAEIIADVEEKINGRALLGEDDSSSDDADEFGFEFI